MYDYLLFDMDGTINDSAEGITKSVQYALRSLGIEEPDLTKLNPFIGPPLIDSFMRYYGVTREQALQAVGKYRERFSTVGLYENRVYDGIPKVLDTLRKAGKKLIIASSKPEKFVRLILDYFSLTDYFYEVVGATMDEKRTSKADVIFEVFDRLGIDRDDVQARSHVLMIGDREHDVLGAAKAGIDCLAVYYGFASPGELEAAGAAFIVNTVEEMGAFLLSH